MSYEDLLYINSFFEENIDQFEPTEQNDVLKVIEFMKYIHNNYDYIAESFALNPHQNETYSVENDYGIIPIHFKHDFTEDDVKQYLKNIEDSFFGSFYKLKENIHKIEFLKRLHGICIEGILRGAFKYADQITYSGDMPFTTIMNKAISQFVLAYPKTLLDADSPYEDVEKFKSFVVTNFLDQPCEIDYYCPDNKVTMEAIDNYLSLKFETFNPVSTGGFRKTYKSYKRHSKKNKRKNNRRKHRRRCSVCGKYI